jgi:CRP/FNR family transcriptional regulator, cyclic AMP receptor protein
VWRRGHDLKVVELSPPSQFANDAVRQPQVSGGCLPVTLHRGFGTSVAVSMANPKEGPMAIAASLDFSSRLRSPVPPTSPELAPLRGIPFLSNLPANVQSALTAGSSVRRLARRAVLAAEGTAPAHVFVLMSGRIRAVRRSISGREVTLETFHPGDVLADGVVVSERQLSNDWEASEASEVLAISRETFTAQLQLAPVLALTLAAQMLARLERSKQLSAGLALADVPGRVATALRGLAESQGQVTPEGTVIPNRPTQQEMANSIGACRETVSRVVSDLARRGLITPRGRTLVVSRRLLDGEA